MYSRPFSSMRKMPLPFSITIGRVVRAWRRFVKPIRVALSGALLRREMSMGHLAWGCALSNLQLKRRSLLLILSEVNQKEKVAKRCIQESLRYLS